MPPSQTIPHARPAETQLYVRPGFHWDTAAAYLFDIDGTLLHARDSVHYESFFAAVHAVLGHSLSLDGVTLHGNTDPGILRDAFRIAAIEEAEWRPHAETIFSQMGASVTERRAKMDLVVMPGVRETLAHLQRKGAALGVATGNIETIGWIKIEQAGLRDWFTFGGFSDGYELRSGMIGNALRVAHAATSAGASVIVVGDTVRDILAARENGLPTIAVATGHTSFDELMEAGPEACVTDLRALLSGGVR